MNNMSKEKILVYATSGILGGILGYLIAEMVVIRINNQSFEPLLDEDGEVQDMTKVVESIDTKALEKHEKVQYSTKALEYARSRNDGKPATPKDAIKDLHPQIIDLTTANDAYDHHIITYYATDGVFAWEDDTIVERPDAIFGAKIEEHFGEMSEDPDMVVVQNGHSLSVYEIIRVEESYRETVFDSKEEEEKVIKQPLPSKARRSRKAAPKMEEDDGE